MNRRYFLRASGIGLALPTLDAFLPRGLAAAAAGIPPQRMVLINASMGLLPKEFFPEGAGRDYQPSRYLKLFSEVRDQLSVFSGLSHPEVDGGHHADVCFLTGAPHPGGSGFRNTISLDQYAGERIGIQTRFPSLVLHAGAESHKSWLSWTASGVNVPAEDRPSEVYKRLFLTGSPQEVEAQIEKLKVGRSILDAVNDRARSLGNGLGANDRDKLDEYLTSVRELEQRLVISEEWEHQPKPKVSVPMPEDIKDNADVVGRARLMYGMIKLALQTDSSRVISMKVHSYDRVKIEGVDQGHHTLTHHGNRPEALAQLRTIEEARLCELRDFLLALKATPEDGGNLLDNTMVLYGTHMGDANRHSNDNLPVMMAGGGFRHGQHLVFNREKNTPLANLHVSMLQKLGIETDEFSSGKSTLTGLEMT